MFELQSQKVSWLLYGNRRLRRKVKFVLTVDKEIEKPWLDTSNGRLISLAFWLVTLDPG